MIDNEKDYSRHLGGLEGAVFQAEVCAALLRCYDDFQAIPDRPQGDGGLDALTHELSRAYCCYGPEQEQFKVNTRGLTADIKKKFRSDLRKLFELKTTNGKLAHSENRELGTIIPAGRKIRSIFLVVSTFNDHRIIGPLNESLAKYSKASNHRYVDKHASLAIWGPEQVASLGGVSDSTLLKVRQRALLARAESVANDDSREKTETEDFKEKFDWLETRLPSQEEKIRNLRVHFGHHWTVALRLNQEFSNTSVSLHQALESFRAETVLDAELRSLNSSDPIELLTEMQSLIANKLRDRFGDELSAEIVWPLANGETARLVGECPIDWR